MASSRHASPLYLSILLSLGLVLGTDALGAQVDKQKAPPPRVEATRAELEAVVAHPPKGMSEADLASVKQRLANGDFSVGDRLVIEVTGDTMFSDTFTVRTGRVLSLPTLPPLSLEGVLRSESDSVIGAFVGRYLRNPQVNVVPLIRVGVLGGVGRPGYYDVPAESLISEVVMLAGGLGQFGTMKKAAVYRGNEEVMDAKATNVAITNGITLDLLNLQSGDNLNIGQQNPGATLSKVQIITAVLAIPIMIFTISALAN